MPLYARIRDILESAQSNVARSVNTTQVIANWLIGREIVVEEQNGRSRSDYGDRLLEGLSQKLRRDFGAGYSVANLRYIRQFCSTYPHLLNGAEIHHAARDESGRSEKNLHAAFEKSSQPVSSGVIHHAVRGELVVANFSDAARRKSWKPGRLHPSLSWTHYRTLLRVEKTEARAFYEIEAIKNRWSARELERQINSLLYERLAMSKDKKGLLRLSKKGQEVQKPTDLFKDPVVMEFLGLPESPKLVESDLEQALIDNLQTFLLEMGKGFAFIARQERITIDGDHFYIDLVFYHTILKCFVLLDLKVGKLTHQDLGQLQYVRELLRHPTSDQGRSADAWLILCTDKNEAVVRYTLGKGYAKNVFASRYQLYVPSETQLKAELRRELRLLHHGESRR